MNVCILLGKIVSEIEFKFIINSKNKSIVYFNMELLNKSIIRVNFYNTKADYVYRSLKRGDKIIIDGNLKEDGSIECYNFYLLKSNK